MRTTSKISVISVLVLLVSCTSTKLPKTQVKTDDSISSQTANAPVANTGPVKSDNIAAIFGNFTGSEKCRALKPEEANSNLVAYNGHYILSGGKKAAEMTLVISPETKTVFNALGKFRQWRRNSTSCRGRNYEVEENRIVYKNNRGSSTSKCQNSEFPISQCKVVIHTFYNKRIGATWHAVLKPLPRLDGGAVAESEETIQ